MNHRGCFQVYVTKTKATRTSDSLAWFPCPLAPPVPTKEDILAIAAEDLKEVAKMLTKSNVSISQIGMTMASNYNTRGRAAEVLVDGDQFRLIRKREKSSDLFALENI